MSLQKDNNDDNDNDDDKADILNYWQVKKEYTQNFYLAIERMSTFIGLIFQIQTRHFFTNNGTACINH